MRKKEIVDEAQGLVLDAKYEQFEWAKRAVEQARLELGGVIANVGLSASARRIDRSRQWCLQLVQAADEAKKEDRQTDPRSEVGDLIESIRRSGVLEPLVVQLVDDDTLRVVDGHRRLKAAIDAAVSNLPVNVVFTDRQQDERDRVEALSGPHLREPAEQEPRTEVVKSAEAAARNARRVRFAYVRPDGERTERTVDAWGVVFRTGSWYLVGHDLDRQALRTFRISRIAGEIEDVGAGSPPPAGFTAGANVWGKLDPDFVEMLEEVFRGVMREERAGEIDRRQSTRDELDQVSSPDSGQSAQIELMRSLLAASMGTPVERDRAARVYEELKGDRYRRALNKWRALDEADE